MISSVHFAIAVIPLAMYLVLIGSLWLRTRPLVTTGWRDMLALGIAASGLVAIGPLQLFFPHAAAAFWHGWVWVALIALYLLSLLFILLNSRPRLIAYGMDDVQFRAVLLSAAVEVDSCAKWNGDVLSLPSCGIQLALEPTGASRVQQVVSIGTFHNLMAWLALERAFAKAGSSASCTASYAGVPLVLFGLILLIFAVIPLVSAPGEALSQLQEFLNR